MSSTAIDDLGADRNVVAARINGRLMDLATPIAEADDVEPVWIDSEECLFILRHSAAHAKAPAGRIGGPLTGDRRPPPIAPPARASDAPAHACHPRQGVG